MRNSLKRGANELRSISELAEMFGKSIYNMRQIVRRKNLTSVKRGNVLLFDPEEVAIALRKSS